jgi:hypothetical protein
MIRGLGLFWVIRLVKSNMTHQRKLVKVQTPTVHQGFMGPDHMARAVIQVEYPESDPFILLMDDRLHKQSGEPVGGPHPHAGFETVSLLLEGEMGDAAHTMKSGDLQIMTAGSGIIHTETINTEVNMRLLQLWLNLPKKDRWAPPRVQDLTLSKVPQVSAGGVDIKVYSGTLAGLTSPVYNYVPIIIADIQMVAGTGTTLEIPASYNTFLYLLAGGVQVGEEAKSLQQDQVGWLDRLPDQVPGELKLKAGENGCRFILYAGEPQREPIVSHGPFIGDSQEDIQRLYQEFRQGKMRHISTVGEDQRIKW